MRVSTLALFSSACILAGAALAFRNKADPPVVAHVDLARYQGKWYEIARLPTRFERDCASDVTAEYQLRKDSSIAVINTCRKPNGELKQSKGTAHLRDPRGPNSKLKVSFFWPFTGDYWILKLDPQYRWSLVGTPDRRYLWLLSRSPQMEPATYQAILQTARQLGFDTNRVQRTKQSGGR